MIRVLHVGSDSVDAMQVHAALLREADQFEVDHVESLVQALARLETPQLCDVVLTEITLSDGDGLRLIEHVRGRELPIALVAITPAGDDRSAYGALKAGADDYFTKKIEDLARLPRTLQGALERHRRGEAVWRRPIRVLYAPASADEAKSNIAALAKTAPYLRIECARNADAMRARLGCTSAKDRIDVLVLERCGDQPDVLALVKEMRETLGVELATVVCTRVHDEDFSAASMRLGVSEYLIKAPGDLEQLPSLIEQVYARAELERANVELERRVTDRTGELRAVIRELENFAHTVAHDLQAPARAVGGFARALMEELASGLSNEAERMLWRIERNANHMQQMIHDVLELARAGNAPLERTRTDLAALMRECIELNYPDALGLIEVGALGYARVDAGLFRQLFVNLLGNALKFTRDCDRPRIEAQRLEREGEVLWFVRDNGVGFDMSRASRLFQVFQRLHRHEEFEGTGVGLANCARIIERHGGRIWAEAEPGKGATFYFTIGR
jgi:signal transduction histidine kinase/CheY-like chemotaxis protein